jgi:hypothetical protein
MPSALMSSPVQILQPENPTAPSQIYILIFYLVIFMYLFSPVAYRQNQYMLFLISNSVRTGHSESTQ